MSGRVVRRRSTTCRGAPNEQAGPKTRSSPSTMTAGIGRTDYSQRKVSAAAIGAAIAQATRTGQLPIQVGSPASSAPRSASASAAAGSRAAGPASSGPRCESRQDDPAKQQEDAGRGRSPRPASLRRAAHPPSAGPARRTAHVPSITRPGRAAGTPSGRQPESSQRHPDNQHSLDRFDGQHATGSSRPAGRPAAAATHRVA